MSIAFTCQRLAGLYHLSPYSLSLQLSRPFNASYLQYRRRYASSSENLPRVAQPSLWHSIIPKAFRNPEYSGVLVKPQRTKEWNSATFFIWIFLLIGSNAIQMLVLKNEYATFSRKADLKIKLLKDVLDRVQRGESVDVEKVLGTGNEEQEEEWRDVLRELEEEDQLWHAKDRKQQKKRPQEELGAEVNNAENNAKQRPDGDTDSGDSHSASKFTKGPPKFF